MLEEQCVFCNRRGESGLADGVVTSISETGVTYDWLPLLP